MLTTSLGSYYKCDWLQLKNGPRNFSQHVIVRLGLTLDKLGVQYERPENPVLYLDAQKFPNPCTKTTFGFRGDEWLDL